MVLPKGQITKWLQMAIKAYLTVFLVAAIACGLYLTHFLWRPPRRVFVVSMPAQSLAETELDSLTIQSTDELTRTADSKYFIVFIDADWSITAKQSATVFLKLRESLRSHPEFAQMEFRRVDTTEQSDDPLWESYRSWCIGHGVDPGVLIAGSGTIVLSKSGKVASVVWCPAVEEWGKVLETTNSSLN